MRKFIRRYTPNHKSIRENRQLNRIFGTLLHDPYLLHLNRRSVSAAFFIGLFWAYIPIPLQMIPAATCAILFRANLPLSVGLVWISNPITMPPILYVCYLLGAWLLNTPVVDTSFELTWEWFGTELGRIWAPLYLGSIILGLVSAVVGMVGIRLLWRLHIIRFIKRKKMERLLRKNRPDV